MAALGLLPRAVGAPTAAAAALLPAELSRRNPTQSAGIETLSTCSGLVAASSLHGCRHLLCSRAKWIQVPDGGQRWSRVHTERERWSPLVIRAGVRWTEDPPPSFNASSLLDGGQDVNSRAVDPAETQAAVHDQLSQAQSQLSTLGLLSVLALRGKSFAGRSASQARSSQDTVPPSTFERARLFALVAGALGFVAVASPAIATVASTAAGATVPRTGVLQVLAGTELLASAWTGLVAGCLHTLTGPDHLAALAPLSIGRSKLESACVGALWGFGHDTGQVLFGLMFLLLKDRLRMDLLQTWGARIVGMTLIGIGLLGMKESQALSVQEEVLSSASPGAAAEMAVAGVGAVGGNVLEVKGISGEISKKNVNLATTFATGIIHGLQPDALLMVLPALALPSKVAGAAFLMMFLIGTIAAMGSYTAFIGVSSRALGKRVPWVTQRLSLVASIFAMLVGTSILIPGGLSNVLPFVNV
ncbi:hypothetical protein CBR_g11222 [Chara braunii]|uniref:Urease accessory protein UreH-like transmembrane domain-containing protein n=1 Tax=Chara braunii TaxID=69332 RepID=A0A388KQG4_CHABU|nr:hypothetical protein CBR_g11222 [Chara braunii]|eukprot:GBG72294.1 hypothetical protein CBR_g11222 [Chara braunii]